MALPFLDDPDLVGVVAEEPRLRLHRLEIAADGNGLGDASAVIELEHRQRRERVDLEELGFELRLHPQIDLDLRHLDALLGEKDTDPPRIGRTREIIEFHSFLLGMAETIANGGAGKGVTIPPLGLMEEGTMFKRIDHVELVTDQAERTVQFYTELLGFKVRARDRIENTGAGVPLDLVYLELGGTTVELLTYHGAKMNPAPTGLHLGYNLIALEVEDMTEALTYLKTKGVEPVWGPMFRDRYARAEIADPNGYHIELRHWF
jgi:glyoxylase I family protein